MILTQIYSQFPLSSNPKINYVHVVVQQVYCIVFTNDCNSVAKLSMHVDCICRQKDLTSHR